MKPSFLRIGYSTCPNDTFIFYALAHHQIDCEGLRFDIELKDVETLNRDAIHQVFDVSKLSFAALGHLQETYGLLYSGAALGRGCGPLVVARRNHDLSKLGNSRIAIPGHWTTANLLMALFAMEYPGKQMIPMVFDQIMPAVQRGEVDYGVIIHEGRFTYEKYGLDCLLDLGQWWEDCTSLPIPLGGIAIRRDVPADIARRVDTAIKRSVMYAFDHPDSTASYIRCHAQEMEPDVIEQHIDLYVNSFSMDLQTEGTVAVQKLFEIAREAGILPSARMPIFAYE
jgi:1,4-dihydroxy-6-naphthoate synthase